MQQQKLFDRKLRKRQLHKLQKLTKDNKSTCLNFIFLINEI